MILRKQTEYQSSVNSIMIFGIAGGNGQEHIQKDKYKKVYGIDINSTYLQEVKNIYPNLEGTLECLCIDLINEADNITFLLCVVSQNCKKYGYKKVSHNVKKGDWSISLAAAQAVLNK